MYHLKILGSEKSHFTNEGFSANFTTKASPAAYQTATVMDAYAKSFFDQYLKGRKKPFVAINESKFPQAQLDYHVRYQKLSSLDESHSGLSDSYMTKDFLKALKASQQKVRVIKPYNRVPIKAMTKDYIPKQY